MNARAHDLSGILPEERHGALLKTDKLFDQIRLILDQSILN